VHVRDRAVASAAATSRIACTLSGRVIAVLSYRHIISAHPDGPSAFPQSRICVAVIRQAGSCVPWPAAVPVGQFHAPSRRASWPPSRMFMLKTTPTPSSLACASTVSRQATTSPSVMYQLYWYRTKSRTW
jgi:hypothetical protein